MIYRMIARMTNSLFRSKKIMASKMAIILVCRMIGPFYMMNHPKISRHPGFRDKPAINLHLLYKPDGSMSKTGVHEGPMEIHEVTKSKLNK